MSNSPFQADFIELIVREVVRRLLANGVNVTNTNTTSAAPSTATKSIEATELRLTERVVTIDTLRDRLAGVKRVTVGKKAIVTPAVKDELKHKRIELIRN